MPRLVHFFAGSADAPLSIVIDAEKVAAVETLTEPSEYPLSRITLDGGAPIIVRGAGTVVARRLWPSEEIS